MVAGSSSTPSYYSDGSEFSDARRGQRLRTITGGSSPLPEFPAAWKMNRSLQRRLRLQVRRSEPILVRGES